MIYTNILLRDKLKPMANREYNTAGRGELSEDEMKKFSTARIEEAEVAETTARYAKSEIERVIVYEHKAELLRSVGLNKQAQEFEQVGNDINENAEKKYMMANF